MKSRFLIFVAVLLTAAPAPAVVDYSDGYVVGSGSLAAGGTMVAFQASNTQGTSSYALCTLLPQIPSCPPHGVLAVATGEKVQRGNIVCLLVRGDHAFMAVSYGLGGELSAAYVMSSEMVGEGPKFALLDRAGSPCHNPVLREILRASASQLTGAAVVVDWCEIDLCPA